MKKAFLLALFLGSATLNYNFTILPITKAKAYRQDILKVNFNRRTTFNDLITLQRKLEKKNITLIYNKLEFDENRGLLKINFSVDCHDGFKGSASNDHLLNGSKFGFFRDYTKDANSPFGTGSLD